MMYKLIYFDLRALGEPIRWIFKYAKVPFEDERILIGDWAQVKSNPRYPLGQVPILEMDGQDLTQSLAIARYLCQKFGYVAEDPFLNYRSDQIAQIVEDARLLIRPMVVEPDLEKKEEMKRDVILKILPPHLRQISTLIEDTANNVLKSNKGNFIAGEKPTYGDFILANWLDIWEQIVDVNLLDTHPLLRRQMETVMNLPGIKEWIDIRPQTMI